MTQTPEQWLIFVDAQTKKRQFPASTKNRPPPTRKNKKNKRKTKPSREEKHKTKQKQKKASVTLNNRQSEIKKATYSSRYHQQLCRVQQTYFANRQEMRQNEKPKQTKKQNKNGTKSRTNISEVRCFSFSVSPTHPTAASKQLLSGTLKYLHPSHTV